MTRPSLRNILSDEQQSLQEVWGWYEFQRVLVGEEKGRALDALFAGASAVASRYMGKTRDEIDADFAFQVAELGRVTILGMLQGIVASRRTYVSGKRCPTRIGYTRWDPQPARIT